MLELISAASGRPYIFASMSGMLDLSRDEKGNLPAESMDFGGIAHESAWQY